MQKMSRALVITLAIGIPSQYALGKGGGSGGGHGGSGGRGGSGGGASAGSNRGGGGGAQAGNHGNSGHGGTRSGASNSANNGSRNGGLTYSQHSGAIRQGNTVIGTGYSGRGQGRNNPSMQNVPNVGPIPRGTYTIGTPHNSVRTGTHVMNLTPRGHNAQGRSGFQIHGNNRQNNASRGCIVLSPNVRQRISGSGAGTLRVVP